MLLGACTEKKSDKTSSNLIFEGYSHPPIVSVVDSNIVLDSILTSDGKYNYHLFGNVFLANKKRTAFRVVFSKNPFISTDNSVQFFTLPLENRETNGWNCRFKNRKTKTTKFSMLVWKKNNHKIILRFRYKPITNVKD